MQTLHRWLIKSDVEKNLLAKLVGFIHVRSMLQERGITPEELPPDEDIKKVERRVKADEKKLMGKSGKLPVDE